MPIRRNQKNRKLGQLLSILPSGTGVASIPSVICLANLFPAEFVGNYICMHSDATAHGPGSTGFAAVGSPVTQSLRTNLNGSNCGATTGQRLNGTADAFATDPVVLSTGSQSACVFFSTNSIGTGKQLMAKDVNGANSRSFVLSLNAAGQVLVQVLKSDASATSVTSIDLSPVTPRANHFASYTYEYVADGTSKIRIYLDGVVSSNISDAAVGPMQQGSTPLAVGRRYYAANYDWLDGRVGAAIYTEKVLSAATIATMSQICLGQVKGSRGEAITYTRAGTMTLPTPDGGAHTLQPNRIPVVNGGILIEPAGSNICLQSEAFATTWGVGNFIVAAPTVTTNLAVAPDGTLTADRVQIPAIAPGEASRLGQTVTTTAAPHTFSVWIKSHDGVSSGTTQLNTWVAGDGSGGTVVAVNYTGTWSRVSLTKTTTAAPQHFFIGAGENAYMPPSTLAAADIDLWGAQIEASPVATSYMRSGASAGTRSAPVCTVANPLVNAGVDPAATNIIKQSQTFGTTWTKNAALDTLTENAVVAPDGTTTADQLTDSVTLTSHQLYQLSTTGATTYTASVYAKAGTAAWVAIGDTAFAHLASFNVSTGAVGSVVGAGTTSTITPAGNGFYRITMTAPLAAATYMSVVMGDSQANVESGGYSGTGKTVAFWGFQLETGSVATRYIPTTTAAVARAAYAPYEWSIGATVDIARTSTSVADANILDIGSYGFANSTRLDFNGTSGWPRFDTVDATSVMLSEYSIEVLPAHFSILGTMKGPNPYIWIDGKQRAKNDTISGNIMSQPATMYIGYAHASPDNLYLNGIISNIRVKNKREG
jgi:hypothetical protein